MHLKNLILKATRGVRDNTAEMKTITLTNAHINFIFILMFLLTFVVLLITEVSFTSYYKNHAIQIQTYQTYGGAGDTVNLNDFGNYKSHNVSIPRDAVWQPVAGTTYKFYVYSAFVDNRSKRQWIIRIIGATKTKFPDKALCIYHFPNGDERIPAKVKAISENWGLPYSAVFITCNIKNNSHIPHSVSVSVYNNQYSAYYPATNNLIVQNPPDLTLDQNKDKIAVCVKPIHYNYNKTVQLLEFIELNRLLGVSHFTFYNASSSPNTNCILDEYIREGIIDVHSWQLNVQSKIEIRTEGMFAALNDCLYRNMNSYPYVAFLDFDEFLVPRFNRTLMDLLKWLGQRSNTNQVAAYSFQNAFFYMQWDDDPGARFANQIEKHLLSIKKTRRKVKLHAHKQRSKYIAKIKKVVEVGNHFVWQFFPNQNTLNVPADVAILNHYRVCEFGGDDCVHTQSTVDRTLYRYRHNLTCNIAQKWLPLNDKCGLPKLTNFNYNAVCKS